MDFIKLDPSEERAITIGSILFSPQGKYYGFPFEIGSNKLIIYGNPSVIKMKCSILDVLPDEELINTPRLATQFELTDTNLPGFSIAWLYLNGIIEVTSENSEYSLLDYLIALEWLEYFNIFNDDNFYELSMTNVNKIININAKYDENVSKLLHNRMLKGKFIPIVTGIILDIDPDKYPLLDQFMKVLVGQYLGQRLRSEILKLQKPLSDAKKKWIKLILKDVQNSGYTPEQAKKLQELL